jgi:hypothetical protein
VSARRRQVKRRLSKTKETPLEANVHPQTQCTLINPRRVKAVGGLSIT